jgi:arginyl-tRNA synthetase
LLDTAQERIQEKMTQSRPDWPTDQITTAAQKISIGAIKYAFLKQGIGGNIAFSFDESLSLTGQSGPYLQYSYVRCLGILQKAQEQGVLDEVSRAGQLASPDQLVSDLNSTLVTFQPDMLTENFLKVLIGYQHAVSLAVQELSPHHVASYLFAMAQAFSVWYDQAPIIQEENEQLRTQRLLVVRATATVLQHGLALLGIQVVEKM